ncbi:MAG TPA: PaaI family thioesterase [Solirubrobacteraceae bacterium]|jgi:acyl-coenzyme A thioesterase PaaI-like protein|nr:PaaI family thioesterase [Solirubrobacteraceae bacterium]
MPDGDQSEDEQPAADGSSAAATEEAATTEHAAEASRPEGPRSMDGITSFIGMRWEDPRTVGLTIRPELINRGGLLSGVVTYALVDYCMGSTLWAETTDDERIATISISINYVQTATEGEIVCTTVLDRRNRSVGIMKSEVRHEDGRLLVTAVGIYSIRVPKELRGSARDDGPARAEDLRGARLHEGKPRESS